MTRLLTAGMRQLMLDSTRNQLPDDLELVVIPEAATETERSALAATADLFFGSTAGITPKLLKAMARYRLVQLTSAGYESLDLDVVRHHRIPVASNGGANAAAVAEHAIMLMLSCLKHLARHHTLVTSGGWKSLHVEEPAELDGKTVAPFGLGFTGRAVATRLRGWGVDLIYHDIHRQAPEVEEALGALYVPFDDLLSSADIVSIHSPLTEVTRNRFDAAALSRMKPGSIVINTSRGGIVDEGVLHDAIVTGRLAGAGLDVLAQEPCSSSPLFALDKVVFTPHTAGNTTEVWHKTAAIGIANVMRVMAGERPQHLIPEARQLP